MPVTSYHTVNGRVRGESTGGVRTGYLPDALGNVTATVQGGAVQNTYRYKPFGGMLAETGAGDDPKFLWNGMHGYRQEPTGQTYVRARHYDPQNGQWQTVNPRWPHQPSYGYARQNPVTRIDRTGLQGSGQNHGRCAIAYECFRNPARCGVPKDEGCYPDPSITCSPELCCIDFDGDGVFHLVEFERKGYTCFIRCGYPGERRGCFLNGKVHYRRNALGELIECDPSNF